MRRRRPRAPGRIGRVEADRYRAGFGLVGKVGRNELDREWWPEVSRSHNGGGQLRHRNKDTPRRGNSDRIEEIKRNGFRQVPGATGDTFEEATVERSGQECGSTKG